MALFVAPVAPEPAVPAILGRPGRLLLALLSELSLEPAALRLQPIHFVRDHHSLRLEPGRLGGAGRSSLRALPFLVMSGRLGRTSPLVLGGMLLFLLAPLFLRQAGRLRLGSEPITLFDCPALTVPRLVEFYPEPLALGASLSGSLRFRRAFRTGKAS